MYINGIEVKILRTNRMRTMSIKILEDSIILSVPNILSDKEVKKVIESKEKWILNKLSYMNSKPKYKKKEFIIGESFLFTGKLYKLILQISKTSTVNLYKDQIIVNRRRNGKPVKALLENWYREESLKIFTEKVLKYKNIIGVIPNCISVKSYSRRWGSCSKTGEISFNWRLIMAPHSVVNYVVVHELCHLLFHNHSKQFWEKVKIFYPNYKEEEKWLQFNSNMLIW